MKTTTIIAPRKVTNSTELEAQKDAMLSRLASVINGKQRGALDALLETVKTSPLAAYMLRFGVARTHPKFLAFTMSALGIEGVTEESAKAQQGEYLSVLNRAHQAHLDSGRLPESVTAIVGKWNGASVTRSNDTPYGAVVAFLQCEAVQAAVESMQAGQFPLSVCKHYMGKADADKDGVEPDGAFTHEGRTFKLDNELANRALKVCGMKGPGLRGTSLLDYTMTRISQYRNGAATGDSAIQTPEQADTVEAAKKEVRRLAAIKAAATRAAKKAAQIAA